MLLTDALQFVVDLLKLLQKNQLLVLTLELSNMDLLDHGYNLSLDLHFPGFSPHHKVCMTEFSCTFDML